MRIKHSYCEYTYTRRTGRFFCLFSAFVAYTIYTYVATDTDNNDKKRKEKKIGIGHFHLRPENSFVVINCLHISGGRRRQLYKAIKALFRRRRSRLRRRRVRASVLLSYNIIPIRSRPITP